MEENTSDDDDLTLEIMDSIVGILKTLPQKDHIHVLNGLRTLSQQIASDYPPCSVPRVSMKPIPSPRRSTLRNHSRGPLPPSSSLSSESSSSSSAACGVITEEPSSLIYQITYEDDHFHLECLTKFGFEFDDVKQVFEVLDAVNIQRLHLFIQDCYSQCFSDSTAIRKRHVFLVSNPSLTQGGIELRSVFAKKSKKKRTLSTMPDLKSLQEFKCFAFKLGKPWIFLLVYPDLLSMKLKTSCSAGSEKSNNEEDCEEDHEEIHEEDCEEDREEDQFDESEPIHLDAGLTPHFQSLQEDTPSLQRCSVQICKHAGIHSRLLRLGPDFSKTIYFCEEHASQF